MADEHVHTATVARTGEALGGLGIAVDHMLNAALGSDPEGSMPLWWGEMEVTDVNFVLVSAAMRRSFYGSAARGFATAVQMLTGQGLTWRAAIGAARSLLELSAEMHWLYDPSISEDDRRTRTLTFFLQLEHTDDRFLKGGDTDPSPGIVTQACAAAGVPIHKGPGGVPYVGSPRPRITQGIRDLYAARGGKKDGHSVYLQLSRIAHGDDFLTVREGFRGEHLWQTVDDTIGHLHPPVVAGLLKNVAAGLNVASMSAALYLGQDFLPVNAATKRVFDAGRAGQA